MTREEVERLTRAELDELVHELKAEEAAALNNSSRDEQIAYILGEEE